MPELRKMERQVPSAFNSNSSPQFGKAHWLLVEHLKYLDPHWMRDGFEEFSLGGVKFSRFVVILQVARELVGSVEI